MLLLLPLLVASPAELLAQYRSWYAMGEVDALDRGASVMSLLHLAGVYSGPNWPVQLAGTVLLLAPLARKTSWDDPDVRVRMLSSLLVYSVLFNHKAEQPTYVIAMAGLAIWFAVSPRSRTRDALAATCLLLLLPVFVTAVAGQWNPAIAALTLPALRLAAVPCLIFWLVLQAELLGVRFRAPSRSHSAAPLPAD